MTEPPKKSKHEHSFMCDHYPPSKVRWFHQEVEDWYDPRNPSGSGPKGTTYSHFNLLREHIWARSADDTEALSYCYERVVNQGARSASGLWCVCLNEDAPATVSGQGGAVGDGLNLSAVKVALEHAADTLPISWSSTQQIFEAQGRTLLYQGRLLVYRQNLRVREIDRWLEPRDPETGRPKSRQLAHWLMSRALGGVRDVCAWPRLESIVQREVVTLRMAEVRALYELQEAA